ncbi:hypothetical protein V8E36_009585 [Tilletia maclaganii]
MPGMLATGLQITPIHSDREDPNVDASLSPGPIHLLSTQPSPGILQSPASPLQLFMREMLLGMTIQGAFTLFAGLSLLLSLGGIWFVRKGDRIRERSKYATTPSV